MYTEFTDREARNVLASVLLMVLAPVRIFAFGVLIGLYPFLALCVAHGSDRKWLSANAPRKLFQIACRSILALLCVSVEEDGDLELRDSGVLNESAKGSLIVSNHVGYLDIIVWGSRLPCGFVSRADLANWPIIGNVARSIGCIFVNRNSLGSRVRVIRQIADSLSEGNSVVVFPEGTTTDFDVPSQQRWHAGQTQAAMSSRSKLVVGAISYQNQKGAAWVGDAMLLSHIFRQFFYAPRTVVLSAETVLMRGDESPREIAKTSHRRICSLCCANRLNLEERSHEVAYVYS